MLHDDIKALHNSLVKVDDDTYALAYAGSDNDGYITTFTISADGNTISKVATLEHDTNAGSYNSLVKVDDDTYALAYTGNGTDGYITTFTISADGATISKVNTLEHDTDYAIYNSLLQIDSDTYALAYSDSEDDGFITTFTISADGSTITKVATLEQDTNNGKDNSLVKVDANTVALAYSGVEQDGYIKTFTIPADGSSITQVQSLEHDTDHGVSTSFLQMSTSDYALAYYGSHGNGYISTFTISADGATITKVATLEYEKDRGHYNSLVGVDSDTYALAYAADGDDGWIKTFTIQLSDNIAPTMTITAAEGADGFTSNDATLSLTFTSSEATSNFAVGDITSF
uniref:Uncharacterized protein n=1 Tax=uncultured marine crenarchaeote HF4000_APKG2O16 TaxID=455582 RepID=B3T748_9ARCH|nr:hypothetical protein ALOHA_HF4000APKG2O16ctg17g1 [uncultured marine crenarchaeote HF4000_APKG2O16]